MLYHITYGTASVKAVALIEVYAVVHPDAQCGGYDDEVEEVHLDVEDGDDSAHDQHAAQQGGQDHHRRVDAPERQHEQQDHAREAGDRGKGAVAVHGLQHVGEDHGLSGGIDDFIVRQAVGTDDLREPDQVPAVPESGVRPRVDVDQPAHRTVPLLVGPRNRLGQVVHGDLVQAQVVAEIVDLRELVGRDAEFVGRIGVEHVLDVPEDVDLVLLVLRQQVENGPDPVDGRIRDFLFGFFLVQHGPAYARHLVQTVRQDDGRRLRYAEQGVDAVVEDPLVGVAPRLVAQFREVVLEGVREPPYQQDGAQQHHRYARAHHGPRLFLYQVGETAHRTAPGDLPGPGLPPEGGAVPEHQQRRQDGEGRKPAQQHAQAADEPEMVEATEISDHERAVGQAGGRRRGDRRRERVPEGDLHAVPGVLSTQPLFLVPGHQDQPVVDAVPYDDGAQEGGLHVQVADAEVGQAERPEDADDHDQRDVDDRDDGAEVEEDGQGDQ